MSGLFASLSVGRAWEKLSSFMRVFRTSSLVPSSSTSSHDDNLEELRKLERTMYRIRAMLDDAEEHWNIREESAKLRLKELKELAYDIEDVVDEYEYEVLHRSTGLYRTGKRKHREVIWFNDLYLCSSVRKFLSKLYFFFNSRMSNIQKFLSKLYFFNSRMSNIHD
jgi:hypothetical protein